MIRTTMVAPIVFSLLYWTGRLITYLIDKLRNLIDRLRSWWLMSIVMAGIEEGIRNAAERRAKEMVKRIVEEAAQAAAQAQAQARELEREAFMEFMRNKGVSDAEIDAFIRRLTQQG